MKLIFVTGSILFFIKFYAAEIPSLYSMVLFLIAIILIILFYKKITHFEISKNKILVKMKEDQEKDYESIEAKKKEWNFEIRGVKK
jgi:predicted membrane protein